MGGGLPFTLSRSFAAILGEKTTTHGPIRTVSASLSDYPDLAGWGFAQSGTGVRRKHRQGSWQQGVFDHSSNLCRSREIGVDLISVSEPCGKQSEEMVELMKVIEEIFKDQDLS